MTQSAIFVLFFHYLIFYFFCELLKNTDVILPSTVDEQRIFEVLQDGDDKLHKVFINAWTDFLLNFQQKPVFINRLRRVTNFWFMEQLVRFCFFLTCLLDVGKSEFEKFRILFWFSFFVFSKSESYHVKIWEIFSKFQTCLIFSQHSWILVSNIALFLKK